jgi:phenylalanyl-tRNA synthetase beta chain
MKFSVNWLREFVELPPSTEALAELLTRAGIEIGQIEERGANFEKVIVAQITASSRHPNADRLTVCQVDDGSGTTRQIVCGATNYNVGDKVPLALPGARLSDGLEIRASKLRGIESEGMLCSARELALGEDASGLLILSPDAKIGGSISELFPTDIILDAEITPNRGDLLSHFGLAREIGALVGRLLRLPNQITAGGAPALQKKGVKISAPHECPFFSARKINNIQIGPSPEWLRAKIEAVGIRSINNIVDISNLVMLELGQPTHAFDADKLKGGINVRLAREGETILALDGRTYSLNPENLVIADNERAVGIGGVMGGEETGVTESTKNVLLESAYFLPASVRRTARNLNLPSDASYRFERGVDPQMILRASNRAAELIREIADGNPATEVATAGKLPPNPTDISLRYEKCDQLLGIAIEPKRVDEILSRFGLSKTRGKGKRARWKIPSQRRDLQRDVDLIEEIIRAYGIQKIVGTDRSRFTAASAADRAHEFETKLREDLMAQGLSEARTSKLIPRDSIAFGENAIELRNPLSEDHVALRPSLLPGLLNVVTRNLRGGATSIRLFELGRVFEAANGSEHRHLAIVFCGRKESTPHWRSTSKRSLDFFDIKGVIESLAPQRFLFQRVQRDDLALATEISLGGKSIGLLGQLAAARATVIDATDPVVVAEMEVDPRWALRGDGNRFREIARFPSIVRDIAMIVPETLSHAQILAVIESAKEPLLERVELFDLFSGKQAENFGRERKSLAYTLTYRDRKRTLTSDEVTEAHARIRERLQRELAVAVRE